MIARAPIRVTGVLTDATFRTEPCDCANQDHDIVVVGRLVHSVCRGCHRDLDWPAPLSEIEETIRRARTAARRRWAFRWLLAGLILGAVLVAVVCALVPTHV